MDVLVLLVIFIFFIVWFSLFGLVSAAFLLRSLIGFGLVIVIISIVFLTSPILINSGIYLLIFGVILIFIGLVSFRPVLKWEEKISKIKMYKDKNKDELESEKK